jgi:mRNA interferase RelE/StbE
VPAAYEITALPAVDKDLDRLSREAQRRLSARIDGLATEPRPPGAEAIAGHPGYYRVRVGAYRIVYGVDDAARVVTIVIVAHRSEVYDRMKRRL